MAIISEQYKARKLCDRLLSKINILDNASCWYWTGNKNEYGYGRFKLHGKTVGAHRLIWEVFNKVIPDNMNVLHKCDNPGCVNPDHLFLGTQKDNVTDMIQKNRRGDYRKLKDGEAWLVRRLVNAGFSQAKIAPMFKCSRWPIRNVMNPNGPYQDVLA
jgi:hypothetical protein